MRNKYARDDPDWTPNNYDITISKDDINEDLPLPSIVELNKEIKEYIPLTKKVHIIIEDDYQFFTPLIRITTNLYATKGERLL